MKTNQITTFAVAAFLLSGFARGEETPETTAPDTADVSGFVYEDSNENGAFDEGESPMEGARVSIVKMPAKKIFDTQTTDEKGRYLFEDVPAGSYPLEITFPSGESILTEALKVAAGSGDVFVAVPLTGKAGAPKFASAGANTANTPRSLDIAPTHIIVTTKDGGSGGVSAKAAGATIPPNEVLSPSAP